MELPTVHSCLRLNEENEQLLRKLKKLRLKNEHLEAELSEIQEHLQLQQPVRDCILTREIQVQTESHLWETLKEDAKEPKIASDIKDGKLLHMYHNLQKRYDNELKRNKLKTEAVASLTIRTRELELLLQAANLKLKQMEIKKVCKQTQTILKGWTSIIERRDSQSQSRRKKTMPPSRTLPDLLLVIENLKKEKEKLYKEKRMLKNELAGLDKEFFDEIEDLKFALQESVKLNNQYEKCLKQISTTFGLPFAEFLLNKEVPVT